MKILTGQTFFGDICKFLQKLFIVAYMNDARQIENLKLGSHPACVRVEGNELQLIAECVGSLQGAVWGVK